MEKCCKWCILFTSAFYLVSLPCGSSVTLISSAEREARWPQMEFYHVIFKRPWLNEPKDIHWLWFQNVAIDTGLIPGQIKFYYFWKKNGNHIWGEMQYWLAALQLQNSCWNCVTIFTGFGFNVKQCICVKYSRSLQKKCLPKRKSELAFSNCVVK